jgi:hypothetical protein
MTRITNAEQVLMLLRSHLERAKRTSKPRGDRTSARTGPLSRVSALAGADGLSEADIARALIAGLLTEEFGAEFAVEPRFHGLVEDVRQIIAGDEAGSTLLRNAIAQIAAPQQE